MAKPIVDRLEKELQGQAQVIRLNLLSRLGQEVAGRYAVRGVPTFLIFDGKGHLLGRQIGFPDRPKIRALVAQEADEA